MTINRSEDEPEINPESYWKRVEEKRDLTREFVNNPTREKFQELAELLDTNEMYEDVEAMFINKALDNQDVNDIAISLRESVETESPEKTRQLDQFGWPRASEVLRALDPDEFAILNKKSAEGMRALGYSTPNRHSASSEQYQNFVDDVREAFEVHDLQERVEEKTGTEVPDWSTDLEIADMSFYMHSEGVIDLSEGTEPLSIEKPDRADEIARQLRSEKQVIFYGPPGTGKRTPLRTSLSGGCLKIWTEVSKTTCGRLLSIRPSRMRTSSRA